MACSFCPYIEHSCEIYTYAKSIAHTKTVLTYISPGKLSTSNLMLAGWAYNAMVVYCHRVVLLHEDTVANVSSFHYHCQ